MTPEQMEAHAATLAETAEAVRRMPTPTLETLQTCAALHNAAARWAHVAVVARHTQQAQVTPQAVAVQQRTGGKQR